MPEAIDLTNIDPSKVKVIEAPKADSGAIDLSSVDPSKVKVVSMPEKPRRFTPVESGLIGATQGASFGFGDEIAGGLLAAVDKLKGAKEPFKDLYAKRRDEQRSILNEAHVDNPGSYTTGEIAGTVGSSVIPGLGPAGAGAKIGTVIAKSAGLGALTGAGLSEADPTKSPEDLKSFAGDVAGGAAIGGALGGAGKAVGNVVQKLSPTSLEEYANRRALSAAGYMTRDLKALTPGQQQAVGRELLDKKVVTALSSLSDVAERAKEGKALAGESIQKVGNQIDEIMPGAVSLSNVADKLEEYARGIPKTIAGKNLANRVNEEAANFRQMGAATFKDAQDLKNQFKYKLGDADSLISNQDVTNKIRSIINTEMEDTVKNVASDPNLINAYKDAKAAYGAMSGAQKTAESRLGNMNANRTISLTDYVAGVAGATTGGPGAAVAMGALNKIARKYGASVQAVTADKLADGIEAALEKTPDLLKRAGPIIEQAAKNGNKALIGVHLGLMKDPDYAEAMRAYEERESNAFERRLRQQQQGE